MTALITVDCLGKRFDVHILASEEEQTPQKEASAVTSTANDNHVTNIEVQTDAQGDSTSKNGLIEKDNESDLVLETIGQLRDLIGEKFQIESDTAKIIHRGKLIGTKSEERLSTLRFKDKDVIKVMGKASADPGFSKLCVYEKTNLVKLNNAFEQNGKDLDLLERNFLEGANRAEMIKKTEKILRLFNVSAEKHLEAIDALEIYNDGTPEDQKTKNREKRKQLVNGVLTLLNLNDKYLHKLDDYKFKTEHPDEGR